jgi:hypothetical protein
MVDQMAVAERVEKCEKSKLQLYDHYQEVEQAIGVATPFADHQIVKDISTKMIEYKRTNELVSPDLEPLMIDFSFPLHCKRRLQNHPVGHSQQRGGC